MPEEEEIPGDANVVGGATGDSSDTGKVVGPDSISAQRLDAAEHEGGAIRDTEVAHPEDAPGDDDISNERDQDDVDDLDADSLESGDNEKAPRSPVFAWRSNQSILGYLVLHYEARDIRVMLDGNSALRILTAFARRLDVGLTDHLDPEQSTALSGWLVVDIDEPLAMSWEPGLPRQTRRTVIDPPPSAA